MIKEIKKLPNFLGDVRQEVKKITWPGRKEVLLTSVFVFIFTVVAAIFFFVVDTFWFKIIQKIIGG